MPSTRRAPRALAVPLLTIALLLVVAPALAGERTLQDATRDVWVGQVTETKTRDLDGRQGDVVRTRLRYQHDAFVMRTAFREVRRAGQYAGYRMLLGTGSGLRREVLLEASPGRWDGSLRVFRRNGSLARCAGARGDIDYAGDVVTMRVPRSCLGDAGRVHAKVDTWWADDADRFHVDNPHNERASSDQWSAWVPYGT